MTANGSTHGTNGTTNGTTNGHGEAFVKPATRLRQLLSQPGVCVQAPGVYDGICARLAVEQGFQVMVRAGSCVVHPR